MLQRFLDSGKPTLPGVVVLDEDDALNYSDVSLPPLWGRLIFKRDCVTNHLNKVFSIFPNEDFYGFAADDLVPEEGWDVFLSKRCEDIYIAYGDDGIQGEKLCTHSFIGGDLIRKVGWMQYPKVKHLYGDTVWKTIGSELGLLRYYPEIKTTHLHFSNGGTYDKTYAERHCGNDESAFVNWKENEWSVSKSQLLEWQLIKLINQRGEV